MANQGGFDFSDTNASANAKIKPPSEQFNSADGQLKEARDPLDAGSVSESVTNKFRAEAGLTSFDSGRSSSSDFREFRESIRSSSGVGSVETKQTTFQTPEGALRGFEHSGKDASGRDTRMFTSESGERFRVERGEDGRTSLRSENSGQRTEALRTQYDVKSINRSAAEVGPAKVHRAGEPVDISSSEYTARARETRAAVEQQFQGGRPGSRPVEQPQGDNPRNRPNNVPVEDTGGKPPREGGRVVAGEVDPRRFRAEGRPDGRPVTGAEDLPRGRRGEPADIAAPRPQAEREGRPRAEGDGRPFDAREFRRAVESVDANPQDRQARADLTRMMRENPGDASRAVRAMQADGERTPAQVERFARMVEARNARGQGEMPAERSPGQQGPGPEHGLNLDQLKGLARGKGAETANISPADLKALSANPEAVRELMQNPETRKMLQALQGREGNLENLSKQLGLDANDPRTAKFFQELGNRLQTLKPGDLQAGNMKLQDVLKGLDPQSSKALENYLTHGIGKTGELRLSQVDQLRLNSLRGMLEGQGTMQRSTDLSQLLNTLKTRPLNLDQPTAAAFGQNLRDLGLQLKGTDISPGMRLQDLINRSPDAKSLRNPLGTTGNDFVARLNGPQEQMIKTLLENSGKLANLIESGQLNIKMDLRNPILADVMTRLPQSMRGDNFVVRGDITGIIGTQAALTAMDAGLSATRAGGLAQAAEQMNLAGRSDIPQSSLNPSEILSGKPIDPVSGLPYDPFTGKLLDPTTGRVVGSVRPGDMSTKPGEKSDDSKRELENKDLELEQAAERKRRMMLLMLHAKKLREQKEKEIREKELKEQKQKQDDKKRTKYVVKYGDTLESIAQKELRNIRLSALIYDINKKIIPVVQEGGKSVVKLRKGLVIWLPSPFEQREFKNKIATGGGTISSSGSATAADTNNYATPEEELAAKFGTNWSGADGGEGGTNVSDQILADSIKKSEDRIKNIESVLGDFDRPRPGKAAGSSGKYVVRLGDTLKSVAMKHPLIRDISLWKLLAEVNNLSTATDAKGNPKAGLTRGSSIKIPSQDEIKEYREKLGLTRAFDPQASRLNMGENQPKLHLCDGCGRMSAVDTLCPCGHGQKKTLAPTRIEPSINTDSAQESSDIASSQNRIGGEAVKTDREEEASVEMPVLDPASGEASRPLEVLEDLDSMTRLVRHPQTEESPLTYALQLAGEAGWQTLISYEIRDSKTYRHDDYSAENRKSVKIDLPARAAEELAKNDIVGNWKSYKRKFLRSRP